MIPPTKQKGHIITKKAKIFFHTDINTNMFHSYLNWVLVNHRLKIHDEIFYFLELERNHFYMTLYELTPNPIEITS
jgi:hypothetical protein